MQLRSKKKVRRPGYVTTHEAKTHLSQLLERVCAGEEIVIQRGELPIARLLPYEAPIAKRRLGRDAGLVRVSESFDDPLPEDVLQDFEK